MRKCLLGLVFMLSLAALVSAQAEHTFGEVAYVEGSVSITRLGKQLGEANFGDILFPNDLIRTGGDGVLVIALHSFTGMRGTLTINPRTSIYLRLQQEAAPKTSLELLVGRIGAKVSRVGTAASLEVNSGSVVMGVRGTDFGFISNATGSDLVYCTSGSVVISYGEQSLTVPAGKAAERKESERLRLVPVSISNPADFEQRWISEDIEAFRSTGIQALGAYARRYNDLYADFTTIFEAFQKDEVLTKWLREDAEGLTPSALSPAVMREKGTMISHLAALRRNLFVFERVYYRLEQLHDALAGTDLERQFLANKQTAGEFLRKVRYEAPVLARRVALVRYAEVLYAARNDGQLPLEFGF